MNEPPSLMRIQVLHGDHVVTEKVRVIEIVPDKSYEVAGNGLLRGYGRTQDQAIENYITVEEAAWANSLGVAIWEDDGL